MDLKEYFGFPEGTVVKQSYIPSYFEITDMPCSVDMSYAFAYYKGYVPPNIDVSNVTNMSHMFTNCKGFTSLDLSSWDTSNVTDMNYMFDNCTNLATVDLSSWDTSNVTTMSYMFDNCTNLPTVDLSSWDTSNVVNMNYMFGHCSKLISLDLSNLDTSNVKSMGNMFDGCSKLETLSSINCSGITGTDSSGVGMFGYSGISTLKNFGGWIGLKKSVNSYGINKCSNLTYESCINVLNGLYDFTGNGITPTSSEGKLKVHSNFLSLVGDEISIGTNKGWTITV